MSATAVLEKPAPAAPDLSAVKQRQQGAWSSGDYAVVGTTLQIVGEQLCEALDLRPGSQGARRGGRQRQCDARGGAPLVRRHLDRLRAGAARTRARAGGRRAAERRIPRSRRRGAALPRRKLRCGRLDLRRDVHARPGQGRGRADARLQGGRQDRACELDAAGLHRPAVQDARQAHAAARRREVARALGHAGPAQRDVR